ncbi:MerR family transcriptional regulator [Staphylococcus caledonicus]|uniref:MerR family transcriptional regulator n=1 Tax=Staphylococcus caledonicus TaxID=2741333 RepID=UPI0018E49A00|nr:MerR family transcriptional regulator [Staphylococcus caledonicus]MBI5973602.1 MerR family transcriptional regulator [Staphylococcus caledonicus]
MTTYYIQDVSERCKISKSKLRYYEKHDILTNIQRDANNKRIYTEKDIELISLIQCFTLLNMPLKEIKQYMHQLSSNQTTVPDILETHLEVLKSEQALITKRIEAIEHRLKDKDWSYTYENN